MAEKPIKYNSSLHVYGDYPDLKPVYDNNGDFTPCIWGLSADLMDVLQAKMLHSMYMGIIQPGISANADIQPLPRIYGDYPFFLDGNPRKASFTPYIRGLSSPYRDSYCTFFLYPIYMRIIPEYSSSCPFPKPSPHMYGDYPSSFNRSFTSITFTPYIRGLSFFQCRKCTSIHFYPTYMGIIRGGGWISSRLLRFTPCIWGLSWLNLCPYHRCSTSPHIYGDYPLLSAVYIQLGDSTSCYMGILRWCGSF